MRKSRRAREFAGWVLAARLRLLSTCLLCIACNAAPSKQQLTIFAASSLSETMGDLGDVFETSHPGTEVVVNLAGSQVLAFQIEQGASSDIFVSADQAHIQRLRRTGHISQARLFAENELALIVPADSKLSAFQQLSEQERIVLGSDNVPIGRYTAELLKKSEALLGPGFAQKVRAHVVSRESNVRLVRAKIEMGEADAAVVYRTDAILGKNLRTIEIPQGLQVKARYEAALLTGAEDSALAKEFFAFLNSHQARELVRRRGFVPGSD